MWNGTMKNERGFSGHLWGAAWGEFDEAVKVVIGMVANVEHPVDLLIDVRQMSILPPDIVKHVKTRYLSKPKKMGRLIAVGVEIGGLGARLGRRIAVHAPDAAQRARRPGMRRFALRVLDLRERGRIIAGAGGQDCRAQQHGGKRNDMRAQDRKTADAAVQSCCLDILLLSRSPAG